MSATCHILTVDAKNLSIANSMFIVQGGAKTARRPLNSLPSRRAVLLRYATLMFCCVKLGAFIGINLPELVMKQTLGAEGV